jgi:hypothetical protein
MKISRLTTHWDADEAYLMISFLNELADILWNTYGTQIIEQQHQKHEHDANAPPFIDDDLDF